jgi:hypothetical protein
MHSNTVFHTDATWNALDIDFHPRRRTRSISKDFVHRIYNDGMSNSSESVSFDFFSASHPRFQHIPTRIRPSDSTSAPSRQLESKSLRIKIDSESVFYTQNEGERSQEVRDEMARRRGETRSACVEWG